MSQQILYVGKPSSSEETDTQARFVQNPLEGTAHVTKCEHLETPPVCGVPMTMTTKLFDYVPPKHLLFVTGHKHILSVLTLREDANKRSSDKT